MHLSQPEGSKEKGRKVARFKVRRLKPRMVTIG
jgi:hypothetical protein